MFFGRFVRFLLFFSWFFFGHRGEITTGHTFYENRNEIPNRVASELIARVQYCIGDPTC